MANSNSPAPSQSYLDEDRSYILRNAVIIFIVISTLCVATRFIGRAVTHRGFGLDDWLMIPSWIMFMGLCTIGLLFIRLADAGRHLEWVVTEDPTSAPRFFALLYSFAAVDLVAVFFPKVSIVCFYYKTFGVKRYIRISCWAAFIFLLLVCIVGTSTTLALCIPAQKFWHPEIPGKCLNENTVWRWETFFNIVTDIPLLIIPIPEILNLQVPMKTRISLLFIMIAACGGMIAAIVKMIQLFTVDLTVDTTFQIQSVIVTVAEPGCYVIAACLPKSGLLFRYFSTEVVRSWYSRSRSTVIRTLRPTGSGRVYQDRPINSASEVLKASRGSSEAILELTNQIEYERQEQREQTKGIIISREFTISSSTQ